MLKEVWARSHKGSPEALLAITKRPPNSETLVQAVPHSPKSNHSLGSIAISDDESAKIDGVQEISESEDTKGELEHSDFQSDIKNVDSNALEFAEQHISAIADQVSLVLADNIAKNDKIPFSPDKLTRFHSRAPPNISIRDYILRIIKFCSLDKVVLLVLLYLADLFADSYPYFVLNSLTVHRFLITASTVAAKGLCDQFCSNTHYAKVGGVSVIELNLLEVEFLTRLCYRIVPKHASLPKYYALLREKRKLLPSSPTALRPTQFAAKQNGQNTDEAKNFANRKHARDESNFSTPSVSESDITEHSQAKAPAKSGNKGLKAMKETFRFLQPSKKKRGESNG